MTNIKFHSVLFKFTYHRLRINMNTTYRTDYATIISYINKLDIRVFDFVNHLTKEDLIGTGSAMNVYSGHLKAYGKEPVMVALKEPRKRITDKTRENVINPILDDIRQELRMMKHFEAHPYIINLYGVAFQDLKPILIVEYAHYNLTEYLSEQKSEDSPVDWPTKSRFCNEVADGLHALHQVNIVHGDIKGDNILLFPDENDKEKLITKISDFGFSSTKASIAEGRGTGMTRIFCAPECTESSSDNLKLFKNAPRKDNYSYGLLVWQIAMDGEEPFNDMDIQEIDELKHSDKDLNILMTQLNDEVPEEFKIVILGMIRYDPCDRISLMKVREIMKNNNDAMYIEGKSAFEVASLELPRIFGIPIFHRIQLMALSSSIKSKIVRSYELLASNGNAEAAYYLSICYASGFGVKMDKEKMVSWAIKTAEYGNMEAIKVIASHYQMLRDLCKYATILFPWLLKTAETGHRDSIIQISDCYYSGIGIEKDVDECHKWVMKLSSKSDSDMTIPKQLSLIEYGLHRATREGNLESVKFIMQHEKSDINMKDHRGRTPLHISAKEGHIDIVQILVAEFGADVDAKDFRGQTPLHIAAIRGHIDIVRLLVVESGADVDAKDELGRTPLHLAVSYGHINIVKLLAVEYRTDVNARDNNNLTPLHFASRYGHIGVINLLVDELGADVNAVSSVNEMPLSLAIQGSHEKIAVALLERSYVDINMKDANGQTLLHLAVKYQLEEVIKIIIKQYHPNIHARDLEGYTPLELSNIHFDVGCDGCRKYPIVGERHKCMNCDNFDFCSTCYSTVEHNSSNHVFKIIDTSKIRQILLFGH